MQWSGVICVVTGFCTVLVQRLQASKCCIISLTSGVALAIKTGVVTSALVSYPDPSARGGHLVWEGGAQFRMMQYSAACGPWLFRHCNHNPLFLYCLCHPYILPILQKFLMFLPYLIYYQYHISTSFSYDRSQFTCFGEHPVSRFEVFPCKFSHCPSTWSLNERWLEYGRS